MAIDSCDKPDVGSPRIMVELGSAIAMIVITLVSLHCLCKESDWKRAQVTSVASEFVTWQSNYNGQSPETGLNMAEVFQSLQSKTGYFRRQNYFAVVEMSLEYTRHSLCSQVSKFIVAHFFVSFA